MSLIPYIPLADLGSFRHRMDQLLHQFLGDSSAAGLPPCSVTEDERVFSVTFQVGTLAPEDLHVELHGSTLVIRGERHGADEEGDSWQSSFERRFHLPRQVAPDQVRARLADEVLTVTIPKGEPVAPARVPVERSA